MEDRWVARVGGQTLRREHPRAGLHPRPSPAELWKSLWKNSFTLRGPRGQRHQADWRVLLNKSSISPATIIASNRTQPSATPVDRAGGHPSSRLRAEPASTKIPRSGTLREKCFQPFPPASVSTRRTTKPARGCHLPTPY